MYVLVRLLKGFNKPLFYKIPQRFDKNLVGKVVQVPLKNKYVPALVLKKYDNLPEKINFEIRELKKIQSFPEDMKYHSFISKLAKFYFLEPLFFYKRIKKFLLENKDKNEKIYRLEFAAYKDVDKNNIELTSEQKQIIDFLKPFIDRQSYCPSLIHGVTGSGKTEVYKKLIQETLKKNKSVIFLLPEVSLSIKFQSLFEEELSNQFTIIGFHSASKIGDKKKLWNKLNSSEPVLIVGVHLPIILPVSNLGLIIVDEEHESGFQEKKHPKINSKEVAIWRAKDYEIPIILGSATPCLNSLFNVKSKKWNFFQLRKRFSGNFPEVKLVFLEKITNKKRSFFWISDELEKEISETLARKEQAIIYINRRGYCFFIQCKKCGFIFQCPNCSVSLTVHILNNKKVLNCHYCDYKKDLEKQCPDCGAKEKDLTKKGIGTQQVVNNLKEIFPQARIQRADLDSAVKKRLWKETVENFQAGDLDILVGTQLITKGYHFTKVTLVGVLWADLNLYFPLFNSSETTLQQLIQVAGRAGRTCEKSRVIVQAINQNPIFNYLNEVDYIKFCTDEFEFRKNAKYPPFYRFFQIELQNIDKNVLESESEKLVSLLHDLNIKNHLALDILGPSKPIVYKVKRVEVRQVFIKSLNFSEVYFILNKINIELFTSRIFFVPTI
ncbi:primosomal protein N' [Candidatus Dependentiae bacterium]|nr:primosomal protein N' [Candidatus Dependentiae bacterium]